METVLAIIVCISMLAGTLVYVPEQSAAAPIPADAWVTGVVTSDGVTPIPGTYMVAMLFMGDGVQVNSSWTDGSGSYLMGIPSGMDIAVFAVHKDYYFAMDMARAESGHITWSNFTLTSIAPLVTDVLLKGYVLYEDGSPVIGGTLIGMVNAPSDGPPVYANITVQDPSGYYEVYVIPGADGGGPGLLDLPGYPILSNATSEPLVSGMTYWVNLTVHPLQYFDDASIYGTVTDWDTGLPIAGALVSVETNNMWSGDSYSNWTLTDPSGYYHVDIVNGTARVMITKSGYSLFMEEDVDIPSGTSLQMDARLVQTTTTIWGNVFDLKTTLGIAYARVFMIDNLGNMTFAQTDASGDYQMGGLSGTNLTLGAQADGYSWNFTTVSLNPGDVLPMDFGLLAESAWLVGHVTDAMTGGPIQGANVHAYSGSYDRWTNTNETGYYNMTVAPGEYMVEVMAWWNYNQNTSMVTVIDMMENVHDVALVPFRSVTLMGVVTDMFSGAPIAGAWIQAWGDGTMTNATGEYVLMTDPGTKWVYVQAPDYWQNMTEFVMEEMTVIWHNVSLVPYNPPTTVLVYGWVNDSVSNLGIPGATLRVAFPERTYSNQTWTQFDGYYEIWMPPYTLDVTAWANSHDVAFASIDTTSVMSYRLDMVLDPDTTPPALFKTQMPTASVSGNNPMMTYIELTEANLVRMFRLLLMEFNTSADGLWGNYTVIEFEQANFDPFEPSGSMIYEYIGNDTYVYQDLWYADAAFGWVDDGVTQLYYPEMAGWDPIDMVSRYIVRGYYNNATLTDAPGQALFDTSTYQYVRFVFDMPIEPALPGDPGATLDVVTTIAYFEPWSPIWPSGLTNAVIGTVDIDSTTWSPDYTVPSGNYVTLFAAGDWGQNYVVDRTNLTVDNDWPEAIAGLDQDVVVNTEFTVDGSASTDNVGIIEYYWQFTDEDGDLIEFYTESFSYTLTMVGDYTITLVVWDDGLNQASDDVVIHVLEDLPPVADAGPDMTVVEDTLAVFDGSASFDDVGIDNYTWTIVELGVEMYEVAPTYTFADVGTYTVELVVTDTIGQSDLNVTVVTVTDATPPTADAGLDDTVNLGSSVTLDGSASSDDVGVVSWTWTFTDGSPQTLTGETVPYTFTTLGAHTVTLEVADAVGLTATDTVVITVVDGTPPTAAAGSDQTVPMGTLVDFDGSGSSDNVGVVSYTWTFNDGGAVTRTGVSPSYTFDNVGVFVVTLTVEDAAGLTDTDTMTVTVEDTESPVADAGEDQYVLTGDSVDFDGSGSSDNVGVTNYTWTFTDDAAVTLYGVAPSYVFSTDGDITVTLTVRDAAGNTDTDTVVMHVTLANEGPTADAGDDQTVSAGDTVTFDGSGSSDDGGYQNLNYTWHIVGTTIDLYGLYPEHVFDEPGTYVVNLTVTDEGDLTDYDTVTIIVEEKAKSFVESYWWLLVIVAVVVVGAVIFFMMKRGPGGPSKGSADEDEEAEESVEDEAPPEDDEL